jgi:quercetin dioxygenase-like cupin family protein
LVMDRKSIGLSSKPGWNWEKHVKPRVNTKSCEVPHTTLIVSGRIKTIMDDGTEAEGGPGDVAIIPPGHNSWVVGDEPCVGIDFTGVEDWVKVYIGNYHIYRYSIF